MITGKDIYEVFSALVPLYVAMTLAYASVRWWKVFTPEQCAGINRFVAIIAIPFLSFNLIAFNNPYKMSFDLILADTLQKIVTLLALFFWKIISKNGSLEWIITLNSLSTLPNTLVVGVPLLRAMYGEFYSGVIVQIVVLQVVIWNPIMLLMFEYRAAKLFFNNNFPEKAGSIASFEAEPDVLSFAGGDSLHSEAGIDSSEKLHVMVRRSSESSVMSFGKLHELGSATSVIPPASNLTRVESYSLRSSVEQNSSTPRVSSVNQADFPLESSKETKPGTNAIQPHMSVWNASASSYNRSFSVSEQPGITFDSLEDNSKMGPANSLHGSFLQHFSL